MGKLEDKGSSLAFHILALVSFIITLSLNVAALFGGAWWLNILPDSDTVDWRFMETNEMGLLRYCIIKGARKSKYCKFYDAFGLKKLWYTKAGIVKFI